MTAIGGRFWPCTLSRLRRTIAALLVAVAGASFVTPCQAGALTNKEAAALVESTFNDLFSVLIGPVSFVRDSPSLEQRRVGLAALPVYQSLAERGVIAIHRLQDLSKGGGGLDDFMALSQSGVQVRAIIAPTTKGNTEGTKKSFGSVPALGFRLTSSRVESITANDEISIGIDKYRVVQGTHTYSVSADAAEAYRKAGWWDGVSARRFRMLLKHDSIDKSWRSVSFDVGPRSSDFETNHVNNRLLQLGWTGRK